MKRYFKIAAILCAIIALLAIGLYKYTAHLEHKKLITACKVLSPEMTLLEAHNALNEHYFDVELDRHPTPFYVDIKPSIKKAWGIGPLQLYINDVMYTWKPYRTMRVDHVKSFQLEIGHTVITVREQTRMAYASQCEKVLTYNTIYNAHGITHVAIP